jgi:hypothetical protein
MMIQIPRTILAFLPGLLLSTLTLATTVLPVSLERMSTSAELIFYGTVISNETKADETSGHIATFTTFEVIEVVKGDVGATHTIKQLGGQLSGNKVMHQVHGVPRFTIGEKVVVFLPQESRLGFASPLGLSQGRFVVREQNGVNTVRNGRALQASLTQASKTAADKPLLKQPASTSLAEFLQTVRELAAQ